MEKNIVIEKYIDFLKEQLDETNRNFGNTKQDMIEAEGRMVTRYDSSKTELAWLANGLLVKKKNLEEAISRKSLDNRFKVKIGSMLKVRQLNQDNDKNVFKILIGNTKEQLEGVIQLSPSSEGVKSLFGKMEEDIVEVNLNNIDMVIKIEEISVFNDDDVVNLDSIVLMKDDSGYEDYYYICEAEGGFEIELDDGTEVLVVSNKAPIAIQMLGKKINDEVILDLGKVQSKFIINDII
ncbi:GreA/GreB family elongation factor [Intestinibacter sp.]